MVKNPTKCCKILLNCGRPFFGLHSNLAVKIATAGEDLVIFDFLPISGQKLLQVAAALRMRKVTRCESVPTCDTLQFKCCLQGCKSLLSIGGIICYFTSILPYFQHRGMNLDHDFFQMSNLSEEQKKGLHQKWNTCFPQIQVETCAQKHARVKLLGGCRCRP